MTVFVVERIRMMVEKQEEQVKIRNKEYQDYVKEITPKHNLLAQMLKAFLTGGIICCIGQFIVNFSMQMGCDKESAAGISSIVLVLLSVILTSCNWYGVLVKWGGAGALVPITGFANSVAAPAIEYKKEGQVYGVGCKIFTIAGPVILYGVFSSFVLGVFYWISKL